jgi:Ni2+-binding GTPase involved in maturation of urease and hydrogenase
MSVINMYEKSDVIRFLDKKPLNPNIDLHGFEIPFRAIVCAPSGSGKTCFVTNLIALMSQGKGTFATCYIICKNKDEALYRYLESKSDQIIVREGLSSLPDLDKFDKSLSHLVVLDDLQNEKDQSKICNYAIRCRKLNVSLMYLCQNFYVCPKVIRANCNYMIILKLSGNRELKMILSEFGLGVDKETLLAIYKEATREKFQPLIVDLESGDDDKKFRSGFLRYLDPADF